MVQIMKSKRILIVFAVFTALFGYGCKKAEVTDELIGIWETSEPKYAGASFEFKKDRIIIGDIEGDINSYLITKIKRKKVKYEEHFFYDISYKDQDGLEFKLLIYYEPVNEEIRLKHQDDIVWKKVE
jgi:hypothetical protein